MQTYCSVYKNIFIDMTLSYASVFIDKKRLDLLCQYDVNFSQIKNSLSVDTETLKLFMMKNKIIKSSENAKNNTDLINSIKDS